MSWHRFMTGLDLPATSHILEHLPQFAMKSTTCGAWHQTSVHTCTCHVHVKPYKYCTMSSQAARPCPARAAPAAPALCLYVHGFCWLRRISPLMVRLLERGGGGAVATARCEREVYTLTRSPAPSRRREISRAARGG
eukprot:scaffold68996_cov59-Phaeocystis_antarctica.AAC.4